MTVQILHVEDDLWLRAVVQLTFDSLGLRGTLVAASTVGEAKALLIEAAREGEQFELIISDMHLPDGTGLDIVKYVRSSPAWRLTPMLILSGDMDPKAIGRAYALGANAYVDKSPPGRSLNDVVATLYRHWMLDVVSPSQLDTDGIELALSRSISIRLGYTRVYQRLSELLADSPAEAAFWLSRALRESNLVNMLVFLQQQPEVPMVDPHLAAQVARMQQESVNRLTALEHALEEGIRSREAIYRRLIDLFSLMDIQLMGRSMAELFPIAPVAVTVLRDYISGGSQDVCAWIELHTTNPALRHRAARLRAAAAAFVEQTQPVPSGSEHSLPGH